MEEDRRKKAAAKSQLKFSSSAPSEAPTDAMAGAVYAVANPMQSASSSTQWARHTDGSDVWFEKLGSDSGNAEVVWELPPGGVIVEGSVPAAPREEPVGVVAGGDGTPPRTK
jgi:hypothetical protein